jgi:uncharacterized protein
VFRLPRPLDFVVVSTDEEGLAGMSRLRNDTIINVAQLLKEQVGAFRLFELELSWFALDSDIMAKDVNGQARLTRIATGVLATGEVSGIALVECVRCLEIYEQPFEATFDQEFRPTIDIRTGLPVEAPDPLDDIGVINEAHELDIAEPLRQEALLELPMRPVCGDDCPGLEVPEDPDAERGDPRLSALVELLEEDQSPGE